MKSIDELLRENIERWEIRGRGVLTYAEPVSPRPPFVPFPGHVLQQFATGNDGVRHTVASGLFSKLTSLIRGEPERQPVVRSESEPDADEPIEPHWCGKEGEVVELKMRLPEGMKLSRESMVPLLTGVSLSENPLSFEVVGTADEIWVQWAVDASVAADLHQQMQAHFPDVKLSATTDSLGQVWPRDDTTATAVVEFALGTVFMLPLASVKHDPLVTLIGSLVNLADDEVALYQILFTPVDEPWDASAMAAVTKADGKPFFDDGASLVKAAQMKTEGPLFGVVVRLAVAAGDDDRAWQIVRSMAPALRYFSRAGGNEFAPLNNDDYDHDDHVADVIHRRTRRCGMLLNLDELTGLVHLPSEAVRSPKFKRSDDRTRDAPQAKPEREAVCLGVNRHDGIETPVWLNREQRLRHCHLMGGTGTGKSTLLFSMIQQDIESGHGVAVLDPHGDLIDKVLGIIPPERIGDVVLLDPSDEQFIVPFNILSAHSDFEKQLLASDLVSVFQRLSTSWGDQMNSVFQNAVIAFLESSEGGTLADMRRFLIDPAWRERFLQTVSDPDVRYYWKRAFPQLGSNKSIGPIITRLETFLSPKPIRYMVSQHENRLDFGAMMDSGKIFLAKLPQGQIGRENAFLLGSLVMTKLQQMAMSRARMSASERRPFFCYIDEFHNFITPSLAEIFSGSRKYGLSIVCANQELRQLEKDKEVASAVLSNAFTRIVFRVGDSDARSLADGFAHFEARALQSLPVGDAICRIERADNDFNLTIPPPAELDEIAADEQRRVVVNASRATYARPRVDVESELLRRMEAEEVAVQQPKPAKAKPVEPAIQIDSTPASPQPIDAPAPPLVVAEALPKPATEVSDPVAAVTPAASKSQPPSEAGKGGYQHRVLQERICQTAEPLGFRAMPEMQVGTGRESVDVGLIRSDMRIACEISVTTTVDHEVGNVRKCLREGFDLIAVITSNERRLKQIEAAVAGCLDATNASKVRYFQPEELLQFLGALNPPPELPSSPSAPPPTETQRKGWRVKRVFQALTPEERAVKEDAAFRILSQEMRLPPPPPPND
jgi:hypothetical protein